MALNLKSHEIKKSEAGSSVSEASPYVRLSNGTSPLFLQAGNVYSEDGQMIDEDDLPGWFEEELNKLSPEARKSVGFDKPKPKAPSKLSPRSK
jgi:hypothetical protein